MSARDAGRILCFLALVAGCAAVPREPASAQSSVAADSLLVRARRLAAECIIVDTHVDAPMGLYRGRMNLSVRNSRGQFDYVRAREGGLDVPFMSIYIPPTLEGTPQAGTMADSLIGLVVGLASSHPAKFAVVRSTAEVRALQSSGKILLAMGMENGAPINGVLERVRRYHALGIRYITLAHAKSNHLCDSSYDPERRWNGLSPFGGQVVDEMNRVGIMIDVSHATDSAFFQILRRSRVPVIASHSACRKFTPGFERNMSDEMIRALAKNGGVIQMNFGSEFLDDSIRRDSEKDSKAIAEYLRNHGLSSGDKRAREYRQHYARDHPRRYASVQAVADHIDHVVALAGTEFVGFGSDFDGVGDTLPVGLKDVSQYPNLIAELLRRGYTEEAVRKICGENLLRVWKSVEDFAAKAQQ